jgi:hypothetical protein
LRELPNMPFSNANNSLTNISTNTSEIPTYHQLNSKLIFVNARAQPVQQKSMEQVIKIALTVIFGLAALAKFVGKMKDTFQESQYGLRLMYAVAFAEILFSVGLFTQHDLLAIVGLLTIIFGALVTLIRHHMAVAKYGMAFLALVLLIALAIIITELQ